MATTNKRLARKGEETRAAILDIAVRQSATQGFDALTIGRLAALTGLSKSGLFAHFGSKEELQLATLDEVVRRFTETAYLPSLAAPAGAQRLSLLFVNWLLWTERCGLKACPMMSAMSEFDDQPGPMHDAVAQQMRKLDREVARNVQVAIESGDFSGAIQPDQFAFELFGIIAACYRNHSLYRDAETGNRAKAAFQRLIDCARSPSASTA
ncbi:TetR/AcrR family transcriptional regulator [Dechloromonas sp. ARDL1]|uniref:TetR/AcrR family transcriptional regulator n=1 Tax=Dechloromonas sp. ARDL1 TaxID=3322121 RepID=UPI003DA769DF